MAARIKKTTDNSLPTTAKRTNVKKAVVSSPSTVDKKKGVSVPLFSAAGVKSTTSLTEAIFGQKINKVLLSQAVRVYLSNQRSAHAKTKTRAEVAFTTAKPFKQKGTGNARHGAKSAPIFVGGGVSHGPTGRENHRLEIPKKMRKSVLISALSSKVQSGQLFVADLDKTGSKTREVAKVINKMELKFPMALVHDKAPDLYKAARNIKGVTIIPADQLTAYQVLAVKSLVLTKSALGILETRLTK